MAYSGYVAHAVDGLGCGSTCKCTSCRGGSTLSEWYVKPDEDDDDRDDDDQREEAQAKDPLLGEFATLVRIARPYSQLAPTYDRALGLVSFGRTKRAFEFVARQYGIRFASAAD